MKLFIILVGAVLFFTSGADALTVRVDPAGGAPRLLIDGKPVLPRMFLGIPGSGAVEAGPEWKSITFDFRAAADATNGTMHFRFGPQPGDVFLDEVQVTDTETGADVIPNCDFESGDYTRDWTFWPPTPQNTVGSVGVDRNAGVNASAGLHVRLKAPADGQWPDFHIYHLPRLHLTHNRRYRVTFRVRAEPSRKLTVAFYRPGQTFVPLGGAPGFFENQIRLAAGAGVNLVTFPADMPWPAPGMTPDWTAVDTVCQTVLDANPNALLLPRVGMDPPDWWRKAYPGDVMLRENGAPGEGAVVASPQYRRDAAAQLTALVRHLEDKFGEHVAGYHPSGQNTGEWFYHQAWGNLLNGYAPADLTGWRDWLSGRYSSDAALQQAWHNSQVVLTNALVPSAIQRHASPGGSFRDPATDQSLIDWAEFQQASMADCACELARAIHQASGGRKLAVFFYGYVFEFGVLPTSPSVSGHYALRRVLNCPDVDVLCSPISYFDRGLGQSAPSMTAAESVVLAGKLWLNEDDTHTYLASESFPGSTEHVTTLEDTNQELARNVAQEAMRNFGTWWMDLGASGWFNDPGMWTGLTRFKSLDQQLLAHPVPFHPEIAAVLDERSMWRVSPAGARVTGAGIYEVRRPLGRMGAPYGQYLLDDVEAGRVNAKLFVFLNAWSLSASERRQLRAAIQGRTRIWCYAPGYFDNGSASLESMAELTGFAIKKVAPDKALATPTERGRRFGLAQSLGPSEKVDPLFAVADAKPNEILAAYADGSAAIAARSTPDGLSIFVGVPGLSPDLLRSAARESGAHVFTAADCNVYANGPYLALHASQDGAVDIDTGSSGDVLDVLTGKAIGHGPRLTMPLKRGETRVMQIR